MRASSPQSLSGIELYIAAILLAIANFVVVLDMTVANVSVSHIAGGLAISLNEGTYVITSYAVAEAIIVPLTGWLAGRFGEVRVFISCIILFGICSLICGLSYTLDMLVIGRILQGLVGGPLMPMTQTLLMKIFPKDKQGAAIGLWSMTTLVAPVMGPIVGGYICDNWAWEYIFFINIPITAFCGFFAIKLLTRFESTTHRLKIDYVGMILLMIWVAALQFMLDEGKKLDWFESTEICLLALVAFVGLISFLIWEFTQEHPIVDLRVFRHRGYTSSVLIISVTFGAFFGSIVLTPLWLQNFMGYTATLSGFTTAAMGTLAIFVAPIVANLAQKYDPRALVFFGICVLATMTLVRAFNTTDMEMMQLYFQILIQGVGLPFFFVPLTTLALASVDHNELAAAAGFFNFSRTLAGAVATSIVTTAWDDYATIFRTDLVGRIATPQQIQALMAQANQHIDVKSATYILDGILENQAIMLSTNHIFMMSACAFIFSAIIVWMAPRPTHAVSPAMGH